jgi:hypothetical protein
MTKEEILNYNLDVDGVWWRDERTSSQVFCAMDEYAKQEAIGFYMFGVTWAFKLEGKETFTPDEIYGIYLKSKSTN